jgi:hypothetical protein
MLRWTDRVKTYDVKAVRIEKYKVFMLQRAIAQLKAHPHVIRTAEEARALPFVGDGTAEKVWCFPAHHAKVD